MRDLALARLTGAPVHFLHLSTAGSVAMVRGAKASGLPVTAEAAPHHFTLTDAEVASYDPVFKVNPPLRTAADVAAVKAGLADGTIDAIATDHAPHAQEAKEAPFDQAPPGMLGLETALALALDRAGPAHRGRSSACCRGNRPHRRPLRPTTAAPSSRAARPTCASSTPSATWVVDPAKLASRSRNTPYAGRTLTGRVRHTILRGEPVVVDADAQR